MERKKPSEMEIAELKEAYSFYFKKVLLNRIDEREYLKMLRDEIKNRIDTGSPLTRATNREKQTGEKRSARDMDNDELLEVYDSYLEIPFRLNEEQDYLAYISGEITKRMNTNKKEFDHDKID